MKKHNEVFEMLSLIMQLGISMLVPILMCTLFGVWLGRHFGMNWVPVVGFIIGSAAGMESVYKIVKKYLKNRE